MTGSYLKKTALSMFSNLPSDVKIGIYRLMGAKIARGAYMGAGSYILPFYSGFESITIGENAIIGDNVSISAKSVSLGAYAEIKENTCISGEMSFSMGNYSYIDRNVLINLRRDVIIGKESGIASNSSLYTHGVWLPALDGAPVKFGKIIIADQVYIAASVFIMPGVTIGKNAIIGACSVVTRDVAENVISCGNPAKEIRKYDPCARPVEEEQKKIVSGMLNEYLERFSDRISLDENAPGQVKFRIKFQARRFLLLRETRSYAVLYSSRIDKTVLGETDKMKEKGARGVTVIGLSFDAGVKEELSKKKVSWIDLGERTALTRSDLADSTLLKSFKNNGIRLGL